jgi:predicted O-methyltransferase YrrM
VNVHERLHVEHAWRSLKGELARELRWVDRKGRGPQLCAGGRVISIEKDWKWVLAAKRFLWQASGGVRNAQLRQRGLQAIGQRVTVRWGNALQLLPSLKLSEGPGRAAIEMLFLDGTPKETLAYLEAAEPLLADGAVVIADNAGVSMDPYIGNPFNA